MTLAATQRWQAKKRAAGLCRTCGKRAVYAGGRCVICAETNNIAKVVTRAEVARVKVLADLADIERSA